MSLGKIRTLTTFPTGDPAFDRYQQHVKATVGPALRDLSSLTAALVWILVGATGSPPFLNSWVQFAGNQTAAFAKDVLGFIHLRGTVKTGAGAIFVLPTGYRPTLDVFFTSDSGGAYGRTKIQASTGQVIQDVGVATSHSLDGITFDTRS